MSSDAIDTLSPAGAAFSEWWRNRDEEVPSFWPTFEAGWNAAMAARQSDPRVIPSRSTDPVTSHKAAAAITVKAGSQRAKLLDAFMDSYKTEISSWQGHFPSGLTDEEAMNRALGVSPSSEFSKRCSELREAGLIEATGETRPGGSGHQRIVSKITDKGRAVVRGLQ